MKTLKQILYIDRHMKSKYSSWEIQIQWLKTAGKNRMIYSTLKLLGKRYSTMKIVIGVVIILEIVNVVVITLTSM